MTLEGFVENDENKMITLASEDTTQQVIVNNEEIITPDKVMEAETVNQEPVDQVCKSLDDDTNLVVKSEARDMQAHVSQVEKNVNDENEINCRDKADQIASSADVDNASRKTDTRGDKDEQAMVVEGASSDPPEKCKSEEAETMKTSSSSSSSSSSSESDREEEEDDDDAKEHGDIQSNGNSGKSDSHFFKLSKSKASDLELDYGMIDPLELARQVANEVEREVDSRERSCSTSEKISSGGIQRPSTSPVKGSDKEVSSEPKPKPKSSPNTPTEPLKDTKTLISEPISCKPGFTASQVSEVAQESEANTGRGFSGFDLNQEVCSEEVDNPINPVSSTISIVSASRATAAANLPVSPLQFEGTLGWKGSASTSAFRPIPETSNSNSKQRMDSLDIDLNVAEGTEDKIQDFLSRNKTPVTLSLPSGEESSVDASPMRPERPQLDLNSIGDEGADVAGFDWKRDGRFIASSNNRNGWQSPARSSSSSSKQPISKTIDLNLNDPYVNKLSGSVLKQQENVISIFGTKLQVKNKDSLSQPSTRVSDPTIEFNMGRIGHYSNNNNPPYYAQNSFQSGPAMYFAPHIYGTPGVHIPYMVASRGAPVVPQFMSTPYGQPPPSYLMNMGGAGSSAQHNMDLNTGLMMDGGNRENIGGLRQFFPQNSVSINEQQYSRGHNSLQPSSSSNFIVGGKRREPDSTRWEFFPVNKHQQPPWR